MRSVFHRLSVVRDAVAVALFCCETTHHAPTTSRELGFYQRTQTRPVSIPDVVDAAFTAAASALFASALIIIRLNQLYSVVRNGV